jgi:hypothetical protein
MLLKAGASATCVDGSKKGLFHLATQLEDPVCLQ